MAAGAWVAHDKFLLYLAEKGIDLETDTFKAILCTSSSNVGTTSVDGYAAVTNELSTANGYTSGGLTLTNPVASESSGTITFDIDDFEWTASGAGLTARYVAIYDDTVTSPVADPIVAHALLDSTPADVTVSAGNKLQVQISASGVIQIARA